MAFNICIQNLVFFFLHEKVYVMNNVDMHSITISLFSEYEVMVAKQTLYRVIGCETDLVDRRGGDVSTLKMFPLGNLVCS